MSQSLPLVISFATIRLHRLQMTLRQRDVVQMLAEGRPLKEIAGLLDLSEKTVEFHKHHIMDISNLKRNADVVLFALKRGLISVNIAPDRRAHAAHTSG